MIWNWLGFVLGLAIAVATAWSVVGKLIVPRYVGGRFSNTVPRTVATLFRALARMTRSYEARDSLRAFEAPAILLALLGSWVLFFLLAYGLMFLPFIPSHNLADAMVASGSSVFTLGFSSSASGAPVLTFLAAATGLVVAALVVAYLPLLYAAFNRRETAVTMLDSRAGSPAWGPEILARAELVDAVESLPALYERWEEWAADVAETHTTYPTLIFFRSPRPMRSWVTSLLAVLDAASLHLATKPLTAPQGARITLRMGYVALREIGRTLGMAVNDDPKPDDPIQLTRQDFDDALHHLGHVDWELERDADEAWIHFRGWRVNYEAIAQEIADVLDAPPALWSGRRSRLPEAQQPPARPPHREPSVELEKIHSETRQRRKSRAASR